MGQVGTGLAKTRPAQKPPEALVHPLGMRRYFGKVRTPLVAIATRLVPIAFLACTTGLTFERQRMFLSLGDISGGPAPVVCSAQFFDRGIVQYGCGETVVVAQMPSDKLTELQAQMRSADWRASVSALAAQECPDCHDYAELHVYYRIDQEEFAAHAPTGQIPADLLPFLRQADALLRQLFGSEIRNHFEPTSNDA